MMEPKVSIVIPVFNGANYMRDAIDSALNQTYKNCEVIVVNDGSEDGGKTEQIAKSYGNKIRYFYKENGGVATAVNLGIQNMTGEYFAWLSHDDMFYPQKIQKQIEALFSSGDLHSVVFGNFEFLNMKTGIKSIFKIEKLCNEKKITKGIYPILFGLIHFCTVLVSKSRIMEVGLCNESLQTTQDIEWLFRLLRAKKSVFIKEPLTVVRLHSAQEKYHNREYDREQGLTHIAFLQAITECEIKELFGNIFKLYQQMATFYKQDKNNIAFEYARELFNKFPKPADDIGAINNFKHKLLASGDGKVEKICIFCAGVYGKKLLYEFRKRMISIDFFSDNNKSLWSHRINGIECIPPECINRENTLVIVALERPVKLIQELKSKGLKYVLPYDQIMDELLNIAVICIPD